MKFFTVLVIGVAILTILKIAGFSLKKFTHRYPLLKKGQMLFPLIEITVWIAFVFWTTGIVFKDTNTYPYIIAGETLIVIGMFAWFVFKDVFSGAVFRAQNDLNKDDYIKIGDISGQVKSVHLTHIEINSDNGQTTKIPNSMLNQNLISGMNTPDGMEEFKITLKFDKSLTKVDIEEKIRFQVANSPWLNYKNPPVIKLQNEDENSTTYNVLVYALNSQQLRMAEKRLIDKLN
jgi:small-conductance mechanosensitive channel